MKLSELHVGDKATVEIEIMLKNGDYTGFTIGGVINRDVYRSNANKIEVTNVVRKSVEPAVGQVWQFGDTLRTILYIGQGMIFYKYCNSGIDGFNNLPINVFKTNGKLIECAD